MADTAKLGDFITAHKITMTCTRTDRNPNMPDSREMDHWKVTLQMRRSRMTLVFSQGYGHHGAEPEIESVLSCLADDSAGIENAQDFEDWCNEYGFDTDSRKAEKTYKTCEHQAERLKTFLGADLYDALLWHTERS